MITALLLEIVSIILSIIHGVLQAIPITLPPQIGTSILYFSGYIGYVNGIVDVPGVFTALAFLINFLVAWFTFKLFMLLYHLIAARKVHDKQALPAQQKK